MRKHFISVSPFRAQIVTEILRHSKSFAVVIIRPCMAQSQAINGLPESKCDTLEQLKLLTSDKCIPPKESGSIITKSLFSPVQR